MPTFSSAWVAIDDGGTGDRLSILQIGFDKCRDTCDTGTAENNLYVFWAYGRNPGGPCGAEIGPVPKFLQNSPGGSPRFKIQRAGADLAYHYELYMDNVLKAYKYIGDVDVCWPGGAIRSSTANEVFDLGTQSGGKAADRQDFIDVRYRTGNTWSLWSRTLGADCDLIQRTTQDCITSTTDSNNYYSWDTRF